MSEAGPQPAPEPMSLEQRLIGLGLHVVEPGADTLTFTRAEILAFIAMATGEGEE